MAIKWECQGCRRWFIDDSKEQFCQFCLAQAVALSQEWMTAPEGLTLWEWARRDPGRKAVSVLQGLLTGIKAAPRSHSTAARCCTRPSRPGRFGRTTRTRDVG